VTAYCDGILLISHACIALTCRLVKPNAQEAGQPATEVVKPLMLSAQRTSGMMSEPIK